MTLDEAGNNMTIDYMATISDPYGTTGCIATAFGKYKNETGIDGSQVLETTSLSIECGAVEGPVIDQFCWLNNSMQALDTGHDLTTVPLQHTVHCMYDVAKCYNSGFFILHHEPDQDPPFVPGATLDATGSQGVFDGLANFDNSVDLGCIVTAKGNLTSLTAKNGVTAINNTFIHESTEVRVQCGFEYGDTTTATPTTTDSGLSGCDSSGGLVPVNGTVEDFSIEFEIDCDTDTVRVRVEYSDYDDNWFGLVFADNMIGDALVYTTGMSGTDDLTLHPYALTVRSTSGVNMDDSYTWTEVTNSVVGNTLTIEYTANLTDTVWDRSTTDITIRVAMGNSDHVLAYHTSSGYTSTWLSFNLEAPESVSVSLPIVDIYCWESNNGIALDTQDDLTMYPLKHPVHCMYDVDQCRTGGFILVDGDNFNGYEAAYTLDDYGNNLTIEALSTIATTDGVDTTGCIATVEGSTSSAAGIDGSPLLAVTSLTIECGFAEATGPIVDTWCWESNNGIALDTKDDLTMWPLRHTVHCMFDVDQCRTGGFIIVNSDPEDDPWYSVEMTLDDAGNTLITDYLATITDPYGTTGCIATAFGKYTNETGVDGSQVLNTTSLTVECGAVEGPVIDQFCWLNNSMLALDTGSDLTNYPLQHTVHCMYDVPKCYNSGFFILHHEPDQDPPFVPGATLDATGSQGVFDGLANFDNTADLGCIVTAKGNLTSLTSKNGVTAVDNTFIHESTDVRVQCGFVYGNVTTTSTTEASGDTGCDGANGLVPVNGTVEDFNIEFEINCDTDTVRVRVVYSAYSNNWFGLVFAENMIGDALVYTTGMSGNDDLTLHPYELTVRAGSGVNQDDSYTWTEVTNTVDGSTITMEYTADLADTVWDRSTNEVEIRCAMGSSGHTLAYHGAGSYTGSWLTFNLETGAASTTDETYTLETVHGIIMWISWALLAPIGIMSSAFRFLYPDGPKWFFVHRGVQVSVVVLTVIGFIIAIVFTTNKEKEHFANNHMVLGLVVTIFAIFQPLNAYFRPHPPKEGWVDGKPLGRAVWEYLHKGSGYACWVAGCIAIYLGLGLRGEDMLASLHLFGWCGLMLVLYIALSVVSWQKAKQKKETFETARTKDPLSAGAEDEL